jgi:hypothetical protein
MGIEVDKNFWDRLFSGKFAFSFQHYACVTCQKSTFWECRLEMGTSDTRFLHIFVLNPTVK